jgi:hypothetical protein
MQQVERELAKVIEKIAKEEGDLEDLKEQQVRLQEKKTGYETQVAKLQADLAKLSSEKK